MADDREEAEAEGWGVPFGKTAMIAVLVPLGLLAILLLTGWGYDRWVRPKTRAPITAFPAPGLEAAIHSGGGDPEIAKPPKLTDTDILKAKQEIASEGLPGWEAQK